MATEAAIAAVSETLLGLLRERATEADGVDGDAVVLGSPADLAGEPEPRIGLYLYGVEPARQHAERERDRRNPPLSLDLRYLLTAYPPSDRGTDGVLGQHRLLGLAMQTFHDNAILDPADLPDGPDERELQLSLESSGPDERPWVWETFPGTPYEPSVSYHVRPVVIESRVEQSVPEVTERRTRLSRSG